MDKTSSNHMVIDLETLGNGVDAAVLTIGAVIFDPTKSDIDNYLNNQGKLDETRLFYKKVSLDSCLDIECTIDDSTLAWWAKQDEKVLNEAFDNTGREDFRTVLQELFKFGRKCSHFWAKSPSFDMTILESAAKKLNIGVPWKFWQTRDIRTIEDHIDFKSIDKNSHNALEDCIYEALAVEKFYKKVKAIK